MELVSELIERLKARGFRVTRQRAFILEAIERIPGHVTAEAVHAAVEQVQSCITLATVYRTLVLLKELDLIAELGIGTGAAQYALRSHDPHRRAICRTCGRSFEFPHQLLATLITQFDQQYSFVADERDVVIFGWCSICKTQTDTTAGG